MPVGHTVKIGNDWADGYLIGKAAALSEWRLRKEINDPEFERLCLQLYKAKWARENRGRLYPRMLENSRRYRARHPERLRESSRRSKRKKREQSPRHFRCRDCDAEIIVIHGLGREFCDARCRDRYHGKRRVRARGILNMDLWPTMQAVLQAEPWLTCGQIHERAPELLYKSLVVQITYRFKKGQLVRRGRRKKYEYALSEEP